MRLTKHLPTAAAAALLAALFAAPLPGQQPPPAEGDERALIATIESADAPLFDKAKACQRLAVVGTAECVPALAALLDDAQMAHYARTGLEANPDPAVDAALLAALDELDGGHLVGAIHSIGMRRDAGAVGALKQRLASDDEAVAGAAAAALSRIATPEAVTALIAALAGPEATRPAVADACLTAGDAVLPRKRVDEAIALFDAVRNADVPEHLKIAALHGAIRARGPEGVPLLAECLDADDAPTFRTGLRMARVLGGADVAREIVERIELPDVEETPASGPAILKADYGNDTKRIDVTEEVRAVAQSGSPIIASNALAGDPTPGKPKTMQLTYSVDGKRHTVTLAENEQIALDGVATGEPHPRQVLLIHALGDLRQKVAAPVILEAAQCGASDIRRAAIRVLGELGDASAAPVLLAAALAPTGSAQSARDSLVKLEGDAVDTAIVEKLADAKGSDRLVLIDVVGRRAIGAAVPALVVAVDDADQQVALAAIEALGTTVGPDRLSVLLDRMIEPKTDAEGAAAKLALQRAVLRMPDRNACATVLYKRMAGVSATSQIDLLELLGSVGGPKALAGVTAAATHGTEAIQDAATRVLGGWMSPDAAPALLELANGDGKFKVRCLRGYIRIARQLQLSTGDRVDMCNKALAAARRDQERELVIEVLGRNPSADSLAVVASLAAGAGVKAKAVDTAVAIGEKIVDTEPAAVASAMKQVAAEATGETAARVNALAARAAAKLK